MIDNQHKQIKGYRDLTEAEISAMNVCKSVGVDVGILCDKVATMPGVDQRWVAIAKTDLQKGFMALIRSIARPETF
jgi:molybdate-binding protein